MLTVKGIYDGEKVKLLEDISIHKPCNVVVTFVEEDSEVESLRKYSGDEDAFDFWKAGEEDIYQDYLKKDK